MYMYIPAPPERSPAVTMPAPLSAEYLQKYRLTPTDETHASLPLYLEAQPETPKLVQFGRSGHTIVYSRNHELHGYDTPESMFAPEHWPYHDYATRLDPADFEGCPYCDVRAAVETDAGYRHVFNGPLVDVDATERQPFPGASPIMRDAMQRNAYGTLLALAEAHQELEPDSYGPLDYAPLGDWLALWKQAGAEVGTIQAGAFVPDAR